LADSLTATLPQSVPLEYRQAALVASIVAIALALPMG